MPGQNGLHVTAPLDLLIGTRKGAFILRGDATRGRWEVEDAILFGCIINHFVQDPREPNRMVIAARTGHLGPTVYRSDDAGKTWTEAEQPPAFRKAEEGETGRRLSHTFWLSPGHPTEPGVWYAGSSPPGLFRSDDHGRTWQGVPSVNEGTALATWQAGTDAPPDGSTLHSILIDPRDKRHIYIGISCGGAFETTDQGQTWRGINRGQESDFFPGPPPEFGHDPHCIAMHPLNPDRLYQQNHCGIYKIDRPGETWERIGNNMPREIRDIGFPVTLHPRDPDTAWVFPMDGTEVWPRVSPDAKPAAYVTHDAGATWLRQDSGMPPKNAYFTVKRQCMAADDCDPVGVYFGTTSGEVWGSRDEGAGWSSLAMHLPHIYSVETSARA